MEILNCESNNEKYVLLSEHEGKLLRHLLRFISIKETSYSMEDIKSWDIRLKEKIVIDSLDKNMLSNIKIKIESL